jgi:hypothetical protein
MKYIYPAWGAKEKRTVIFSGFGFAELYYRFLLFADFIYTVSFLSCGYVIRSVNELSLAFL